MSAPTNSSPPLTNYFTCTLGEATGLAPNCHDLCTINDFIDYQAKTYPQDLAVAFAVPGGQSSDWTSELFTNEDLKKGSEAVATQIAPIIPHRTTSSGPGCVALLCPSSIDYLFAWLGFIRAGVSVLLVAPQCRPAAVAHLCKSCDVSVLFHDKSNANLASGAVSESALTLAAIEFPWQAQGICITSLVRNSEEVSRNFERSVNQNALEAAFIFHTSGTSTGLPKPIVQSHRAAFGVLPKLDGRELATFTTTPLYHGGISDCFRAWTSRASIWLFPAADIPITTQNLCSCLSVSAEASLEASVAPIKYFSSVPYILQMLAEENSGLKLLQSMDIVGVGGAALSHKVGNDLVAKGINLVSRFGSAECGFVLASHRDCKTDKAWDFLRLMPGSNYLCFEECIDGSGLSELVVKKEWPHISKSNREDGSFATSDLFEPHRTIAGAWRYHSRSDAQITLITGKKFDPAPLEDLMSSGSSLIREVFIFGSGQQYPGALVFPSREGSRVKKTIFRQKVWEIIEEANSNGQDHTRIFKDKLIIMSAEEPTLERSAKGTLIRGAVEKKFAKDISWVYSGDNVATFEHTEDTIDAADAKSLVRKTFADLLGTDQAFSDDSDFFTHGVDSTACTRIRFLLQKSLIQSQDMLPWNVVYDCGNIDRLSQFVMEFRNGNTKSQVGEETDMIELVKRYSKLKVSGSKYQQEPKTNNAPYVVLLTGATGALGAHILDILRKHALTSQVICLAAWAVNFALPLKSFVSEHIAGMQNLLNLTLSCSNAVQFTFCSSTASVLGLSCGSVIQEEISKSPSDAGLTGYSKSKWVAEAICDTASSTLPRPVNILRIGQLTGDTKNGIWNISEAWPLMMMTVDVLDCLPQIDESLEWLPLDTAGTAIVEIAFKSADNDEKSHVYHIVNKASAAITWSSLLAWSKDIRLKPFDIVLPTLWLGRLESYPKKHPAKNLLGFWKNAYGDVNELNASHHTLSFSIAEAQNKSSAMQNILPVDRKLVEKIWSWLEDEIKAAKEHVYVSRNRFDSVQS
ncbi:MAG: hypothetical protein M1818_002763 [Claussenomyces sp. TS43310]|nr:MAG: hypothetical protein M1818_002763 [Claussenomyces sp. TS43310]